MVRSRLEPATLSYADRKEMEDHDKNFTTMLYDSQLFGLKVLIALGQRRKKSPAVYYYPIYLVKDDHGKVVRALGVYEVWAHLPVLDAAGDVDLQKLGEPLLYTGITVDTIRHLLQEAAAAATAAPTSGGGIQEQTEMEAAAERVVDKVPVIAPWIQKFMQNPFYELHAAHNGGASSEQNVFTALTQAFAKSNPLTEADLRRRVAKQATMPVFLNYKTIYDDAKLAFAALKERVVALKGKMERLKHDLLRNANKPTQARLIQELEDAQKGVPQLAVEQGPIKQLLQEYQFMVGVDTLELFKLKLQTADYPGDAWALATLERDVPFVALIFSAEHFKKGDVAHAFRCRLPVATGNAKQVPYVLLQHVSGATYTPISYKNQSTFSSYAALPYDLKELIKATVGACGTSGATHAQVGGTFSASHTTKLNQCEPGLCADHTVLQFYSKSLGTPWPGKGSGEQVPALEYPLYQELAAIPDWRRQLDNFWPAPFQLDGLQWLTVEHYYQGAKFQRQNPEFRYQFAMESQSALSKDPLMAKYAGSQTGMFQKDTGTSPGTSTGRIVVARPKRILRDPDYAQRAAFNLETAMRAKFLQHPALKKTLCLTRYAKLMYFPGRGLTPVVYNELMRVRRDFLAESATLKKKE